MLFLGVSGCYKDGGVSERCHMHPGFKLIDAQDKAKEHLHGVTR